MESPKLKLPLSRKEITFLIVAVLLFFGLLFMVNKANEASKRLADAQITISNMGNQIKTSVDENGNLHGQVEVLKIDKKTYAGMNAAQMDSLAQSLGTKVNKINSILNLSMANQGQLAAIIDTQYKIIMTKEIVNSTEVIRRDSVRYFTFKYKDEYMKFNGKIDSGKLTADYSLKDSLTFVTFHKNTGFLGLGKKKTFIDVQTQNPNVSFTQMRKIELTSEKVKKFSIGPCVNYGFNGAKFQPSIGVSLQYSLIRF